MGWGIEFTSEEYIHKPNMAIKDNIEVLQDEIDELNEWLTHLKLKLSIMVGSTPKELVGDEYKDDIVGSITQEYTNIIKDYDDTIKEILLLERYKTYLNEQKEKE